MLSTKPWAVLLAAATPLLALDCEGSVACGISLIPQDYTNASNKIDVGIDYQPGTRIRQRTSLIEYTCPSGDPIFGADLMGYFESVTSSWADTCGNIESSACPGGQVSIDYTTKDRRSDGLNWKRTPALFRRESHNNCDGSTVLRRGWKY